MVGPELYEAIPYGGPPSTVPILRGWVDIPCIHVTRDGLYTVNLKGMGRLRLE